MGFQMGRNEYFVREEKQVSALSARNWHIEWLNCHYINFHICNVIFTIGHGNFRTL